MPWALIRRGLRWNTHYTGLPAWVKIGGVTTLWAIVLLLQQVRVNVARTRRQHAQVRLALEMAVHGIMLLSQGPSYFLCYKLVKNLIEDSFDSLSTDVAAVLLYLVTPHFMDLALPMPTMFESWGVWLESLYNFIE
jgi:hypothetical protein